MRRNLRGGALRLRYINQVGQWPSGNPRLYYRPPGQKGVPLPDLPKDHPLFLAAYSDAAGLKDLPRPEPEGGTIAAGVAAFLASDFYLSKTADTRARWRRVLDDIRRKYGSAPLKGLAPKHITKDISGLGSHTANHRLKAWRAVSKWWKAEGLLDSNPAAEVERRATPKTKGHKPWSSEEVARFREHWPLESPERLAMELLHWTGARIVDAVRLSEGMIGPDGWLTYTQSKTGGEVTIPIRASAPAFSDPEGQRQFLAALDARPERHAVFIVTEYGKPRSVKGAPQWFARAARAAGVDRTAHGLRKTRATIMAERGASVHQIAAWTGHESLSEVEHYSRAAQRRRILSGNESGADFPTRVQIFQLGKKNT